MAVKPKKTAASKKPATKTQNKPASGRFLTGWFGRKGKKRSAPSLRTWLTASVILNLLLGVGLLLQISNPTSFMDASSGFGVQIPAGWVRQDEHDVFRITQGAVTDPRAEIYAYGQRGTTTGFYQQSQEEIDETLDLVTQQINDGQNQFILSRFGLSEFQFQAERGQRPDGTQFIRSSFTARDAAGQPVEGEHLLLVSMGGGVYSVVGYADAGYWSQVSSEVDQVISSFTAP